MKTLAQLAVAIFFILLSGGLSAQQVPDSFVQKIHYLLALPADYEKNQDAWPLLVFLHGSGESGTDINKVKVHGPPKLIEQKKELPFIVVSPQATNGWHASQLMGMINDIKSRYRVDPDRVYLTGLSMGGFGTWDLAMEFPDQFAAIAPICGGGDVSKAWKLRFMPTWCFHGAKDNVVKLGASEEMVNEVKKLNEDVKFTIYPEAGHDSWTETYDNPELYTWLLSKKRFRFTEIKKTAAQLSPYTGRYVAGGDTVDIFVRNDSLFGQGVGRGATYLKPYTDGIFFFREDVIQELRFPKTKSEPAYFDFYGRNRERYLRVKKSGVKK